MFYGILISSDVTKIFVLHCSKVFSYGVFVGLQKSENITKCVGFYNHSVIGVPLHYAAHYLISQIPIRK